MQRCLAALLALLAGLAIVPAAQAAERPNIVVILLDDLRWDDLGCTGHPFAKTPHIDRIAREGALFNNAFCTTPLCSPSRASILTGLYSHRHGIVDNTDRSPASHRLTTFPRLLHDAEYETAFIGKWHMGVDDSPRPGFDRWVSVKGQGAYFDPELNVDGRRTHAQGYVTDIFNQHAVEFLERPPRKPWLLYLSHKAVHPNLEQRADGSISDPLAGKFEPAERHRALYTDAKAPRRLNVSDTLVGKPALQRQIEGLPPLGPATGTDDETVRNRLRMLTAVDDGVGRILDTLARQNLLDDTIVVFTSDHGYFYGEHGLSVERRLAYEEAIRIPLLVRFPKHIQPGTTFDAMVLSIDLAPTLLELAEAKPLPEAHGLSLAPLLTGDKAHLRQSFLVEHTSDAVFRRMERMGYDAVRTNRFKLIRYRDLQGMDELYDLRDDPYEMKNLIDDPAVRPRIAELQAELDRLLAATNATAKAAPRGNRGLKVELVKRRGAAAHGAVLDVGAPSAFDAQWTGCPSVVRAGDEYKMWYSSYFDSKQGRGGIGLATSPDGVSWQRANDGQPVLNVGAQGAFDDGQVMGPEVHYDGQTYRMWYTGMSRAWHASGFGHYRIGLATSADGIHWERAHGGQPVLNVGAAGSPDEVQAATPSILRDGDTFRMWYAAWSPDHNHTICVANSRDGIEWRREHRGQPVTGLSPSIAFGHAVARSGGRYMMLYMALKTAPGLFAAASDDGLQWTMLNAGQPVLTTGGQNDFDSGLVGHPFILADSDRLRVWYTGYSQLDATQRQRTLRIGLSDLHLDGVR